MSDIEFDFEIIESNQVVESRRGRRKYSTKVWEFETDKDKARYYLAAARLMERRGNDYAQELRDKISQRDIYEIEMETVFHSDIEDDEHFVEDDDSLEVDFDDLNDDDEVFIDIPESLNQIVDLKIMDDFYVASSFFFDEKWNTVAARVPCGVVTKKMTFHDILMKFEDFTKSKKYIKMMEKLLSDSDITTNNKKLLVFGDWLVNAWNFYYEHFEK